MDKRLDENRLPFRIESYGRSSDGVCLPNDTDPIYTRCFFGMGPAEDDLYKKNGMVYSDKKDLGRQRYLIDYPSGFSTNRILDSEGKIINSHVSPDSIRMNLIEHFTQSPSTINSGSYCGYFGWQRYK